MSDRFKVTVASLEGLKVIQRRPIADNRGFFERMFCVEELCELIAGREIAQINHTSTARTGTVRGLHYQHPPYAETKLVSCLRGAIFDVAVDVRRNSSTFLKWHAEILSGDNHRTLMIPEGFAHGFQTMTDDCEMLYLHTTCWQPAAEGALNALDPRLGIVWPIDISERSPRDTMHPFLTTDFPGVSL